MKKLVPIVLALIVLAGAGWYLMQKRGGSQVSEKSGDALSETATSGVIGSIKDAMGVGKKMKCTYALADGSGASSTVFVDGQKFKFTSEMNGETVYGLFDGETQYTWTTGAKKQGWKMVASCMEALGQQAAQMTAGDSTAPQNVQESLDTAQDVQCEAAASEDFSVPTDIEFVDQGEMIKKTMEALEDFKGQLPDGVDIPGY